MTPTTPPQDPSIRDPAAEALEDAYERSAEEAEGLRPPPGYVVQQPLSEGQRPALVSPVLPDGTAPVTAGDIANEEAGQVYQPLPSPLEALDQEQAFGGSGGPTSASGADAADTAAPETTTGETYQTTPPGAPSGTTVTPFSGPAGTQPSPSPSGAATVIPQQGAATGQGGAGAAGQDATGGAGTAGQGGADAAGTAGQDTTGGAGAAGTTGDDLPPGTIGRPTTIGTPSTIGTPTTIGPDATGGAGTEGTEPGGTNAAPNTTGAAPGTAGPGTLPPGSGTGGSGNAGTAAAQPLTPAQQLEQLRNRVQQLETELKERDTELNERDTELAQGTQAAQERIDNLGQRAAELEQSRQVRLAQLQTAGQWMLAADAALEQGELDVGNALSLADEAFASVRASAAQFGQGIVIVHAERARALINQAQNAAGNRDVYSARLALQDAGLELSAARAANLQRQATGNVLLNP